MRYLLDTNVVSELRKARTPKIDPAVACWTDTVDAGDMFISAITVMEIEKGILNLPVKILARKRYCAAGLHAW